MFAIVYQAPTVVGVADATRRIANNRSSPVTVYQMIRSERRVFENKSKRNAPTMMRNTPERATVCQP